MSTSLVHNLVEEIVSLSTSIVDVSLNEGTVPSGFEVQLASVSPLLNRQDLHPLNMKNYRTVSLSNSNPLFSEKIALSTE